MEKEIIQALYEPHVVLIPLPYESKGDMILLDEKITDSFENIQLGANSITFNEFVNNSTALFTINKPFPNGQIIYCFIFTINKDGFVDYDVLDLYFKNQLKMLNVKHYIVLFDFWEKYSLYEHLEMFLENTDLKTLLTIDKR